jgi:hypothetical protein
LQQALQNSKTEWRNQDFRTIVSLARNLSPDHLW